MQLPGSSRRAAERYAELDFALGMVGAALEEAEALIKMQHELPEWSYTIPSQEDLQAAFKRATGGVEGLRRNAREYEIDLVSRDWLN